MRFRRGVRCIEQVANARDDFVNLAPVSSEPEIRIRNNFEALLPGQEVPLIWERVDEDCDDTTCLRW